VQKNYGFTVFGPDPYTEPGAVVLNYQGPGRHPPFFRHESHAPGGMGNQLPNDADRLKRVDGIQGVGDSGNLKGIGSTG
jgi:hypothetical protein